MNILIVIKHSIRGADTRLRLVLENCQGFDDMSSIYVSDCYWSLYLAKYWFRDAARCCGTQVCLTWGLPRENRWRLLCYILFREVYNCLWGYVRDGNPWIINATCFLSGGRELMTWFVIYWPLETFVVRKDNSVTEMLDRYSCLEFSWL